MITLTVANNSITFTIGVSSATFVTLGSLGSSIGINETLKRRTLTVDGVAVVVVVLD